MSQAARAIEWEVDDAAPTRLRWEEVRNVPSDMEATRHIRVDRLAAMEVKEPEDTPIPLARRRDSFPPAEVTASSAEITLVGPPPQSWVVVERPDPAPPSYTPAMSIRPFTPTQPAPFRLLFIALVAFAFTLGMFLALTANQVLAALS